MNFIVIFLRSEVEKNLKGIGIKMIFLLHISDLHFVTSALQNNMKHTLFEEIGNKMQKVPKGNKLVVITGDFHNFEMKHYNDALEFLAELFNVMDVDPKEDVFVIPGNHDAIDDGVKRAAYISKIKLDKGQLKNYNSLLLESFQSYVKMVTELGIYEKGKGDVPATVHVRTWRNKLHILHLNTALVADEKEKDNQLLDIFAATSDNIQKQLRKEKLPTIAIGHNDFYDLCQEHQNSLTAVFLHEDIRAYLCGDKHKRNNMRNRKYIYLSQMANAETIPNIVCYKGTTDEDDHYSDFGMIWHLWDEENGIVELDFYEWDPQYDQSNFIKKENDIGQYCLSMFKQEMGDCVPKNKETEKEYEQIYYENLWKICKKLDLRDIVDDFTGEKDICDLYVYPQFDFNNKEMLSPIAEKSTFVRMITANSGVGKSSLLQAIIMTCIFRRLQKFDSELLKNISQDRLKEYSFLVEKFNYQKDFFPIYIKAQNYNDNYSDNKDNLLYYASEVGDELELLTNIIKKEKNNVLLLIDALDEIEEEKKNKFCYLLDSMIKAYGDISIILTCRPIDVRIFKEFDIFNSMERWDLKTFNEDKIRELIQKWLIKVSPEKNHGEDEGYSSNEINEWLIANRFLLKLVRNPYMLSQVLYYRSTNGFSCPNDILSYIITKLIEKRWPLQKYYRHNISAEHMRKILSYISWDKLKTNKKSISEGELANKFLEASKYVDDNIDLNIKTCNSLIKEMNARAGILIPTKSGYIFQMQVIENYLIAEHLLERTKLSFPYKPNESEVIAFFLEEIPKSLKGECWKEVILMFFSLTNREGQRDYYSIPLYKVLMFRHVLSLDKEEMLIIEEIFVDVLQQTFGTSILYNKANGTWMKIKKQIAKVISQNTDNRNSEQIIKYMESSDYQKILEDI